MREQAFAGKLQPIVGSEDFHQLIAVRRQISRRHAPLGPRRGGVDVELCVVTRGVPVFVPGCSRVDFSCSLGDFEMTLQSSLAAQRP